MNACPAGCTGISDPMKNRKNHETGGAAGDCAGGQRPAGNGVELIFPPFADPTWPYVSLPTLKGYLQKRGIGATVRDFNIEGLHFLTAAATIAGLRKRLHARFADLNGRRALPLAEQMEYRRLAEAMKLFRDFAACREALQAEGDFYDRAAYLDHRDGLENLFTILEAAYFPFRFSFNRAQHLTAPWDFDLLEHYIAGRLSPFEQFYRETLAHFTSPKLIGISLTFVSQIPETFYLCRLIRELFPECFILLGGSCIDQMVRHGLPEAVAGIFDYADAVAMQEGEKTLELLLSLPAGKATPEELARIPNLVCRNPATGALSRGPEWVMDLRESAAPDYSDLDLRRYLAPGPMLLYSPTRGCYWNKCSFCCYGFNQSGRHGYREIPVAQAVADLRLLSEEYGAANFYLSCDVLSPAYAFDLAERIIAEGLDIRWSTDLRLEAAYTPERCRLLYRAGLRAVALGVESGSARVLEHMNKGLNPERIREISRNFHQAGIAVSWMTFLGHPGETVQEGLATLALIEAQAADVDQFIVGDFNLTPGSLIAGKPGQYGIGSVFYAAGDIFRQFPLHVLKKSAPRQDLRDIDLLERKLKALSGRYHLDHYPWAGSISTHHSFLHILRFGQDVFSRPWQRAANNGQGRKKGGGRCRHDLRAIRKREEKFMAGYLQHALRREKGGGTAPLSFVHFENAVREFESGIVRRDTG